jgi:hypothetical protein
LLAKDQSAAFLSTEYAIKLRTKCADPVKIGSVKAVNETSIGKMGELSHISVDNYL